MLTSLSPAARRIGVHDRGVPRVLLPNHRWAWRWWTLATWPVRCRQLERPRPVTQELPLAPWRSSSAVRMPCRWDTCRCISPAEAVSCCGRRALW
jgi:hypothetical protein